MYLLTFWKSKKTKTSEEKGDPDSEYADQDLPQNEDLNQDEDCLSFEETFF